MTLTLVSSSGPHHCFCEEHWWVFWWWPARWRFGNAAAPTPHTRANTKEVKKSDGWTHRQSLIVCELLFAYREALCDGDLDVEEKNSSPESSTGSNRLFGITEHTANTGRKSHHLLRMSAQTIWIVNIRETWAVFAFDWLFHSCILNLDDVHARHRQAHMVSCCSPVQRLIMQSDTCRAHRQTECSSHSCHRMVVFVTDFLTLILGHSDTRSTRRRRIFGNQGIFVSSNVSLNYIWTVHRLLI